jgi:hypothetical protein
MSDSNSITTSASYNFAPCSLRQPGDPLPFDFYYDHMQKRYFQPNSKQLKQIKSLYPGVTCAFIHGIILCVQTELLPDYPPLTIGGLPVVFDLPFTWSGSQARAGNYIPGEMVLFNWPTRYIIYLTSNSIVVSGIFWTVVTIVFKNIAPLSLRRFLEPSLLYYMTSLLGLPITRAKYISSYRLPYVLGDRTVYYTSGVKVLKEIQKSREFEGPSALPGQLVHSNALGNEARWCSVSTPSRKIPFLKIGSALVVPGDPRTKQAPQRAYNLLSFGGDISQEKLGGSPVVADGRKDRTDEAEVIGFLRYINGQMILAEVRDELCRVGTGGGGGIGRNEYQLA